MLQIMPPMPPPIPTDTVRFLAKVIVLSAVISVAIKTIGPLLPIPATNAVAGTMVVLPALLLGLALGVQYRLQHR
jgi:hypothetical protein